ncbi:alpha/beta hydrolase [Flavobacteriaceae bacterium]|jgi:predicted alpha/beta-fold hydrolase|nr:alpha/beta hydrolase [Flavobacteriaceae bacterium]
MKSLIPKLVGALINFIGVFSSAYASKLALQLFSKPRGGQLTPKGKLFLDTATKTTLYYNDLPIQTYQWNGSKETVLLAHGWESNSNRWRYEIEKLQSEGYNIIALDGPAHGGSGSNTFNAILYSEFINVVSQKFKPTLFLGHSVGAMAVIIFLQKQTYKDAKKIVLLGAPSAFTGIMERYSSLMGYSKTIDNGIDRHVKQKFGHPCSYFSTANFVSTIDSEGLIIHDKKDPIIPYQDALDIDAQFKNAQLISTESFGHSLKGEFVTGEIIKFLNH